MSDLSVIAPNHRVVGTISAGEDLVVQGRVEGKILSEATLVIDASAVVEGDILARHVIVRGVVIGEVAGVEAVELASSGQILGDIKTRRLALKAGGRVAGSVLTGVEVPAHSVSRSQSNAWQRQPARPTMPSAPVRNWSEEFVETSSHSITPSTEGT